MFLCQLQYILIYYKWDSLRGSGQAKWKMNEFRTSLFNLVNESKQRFCELADKTLNKLLDNMNNIEIILANETENTLRNQVIDQKIDILFKEIFNFLNDLNSRQ